MNLYREESNYPKVNAQRNLCGRTHYVDDDTLRWHKCRILSSHVTDNGLLFSIVTSDALDCDNTQRGFRYVIFDIFGTVIDRPNLEETFKTRKAATKAMWSALNALDAKALTKAAADTAERNYISEIESLRKKLETIGV